MYHKSQLLTQRQLQGIAHTNTHTHTSAQAQINKRKKNQTQKQIHPSPLNPPQKQRRLNDATT